jgi:predicted RNA-binding Zn-ribbon protein involved in translation (DUF1610 family)
MTTFNPDSYCGIYCGACSIMMAGKTGHKDRLASFWAPESIKKFLAFQGIPHAGDRDLVLECCGCKSDQVFINCRGCKIRECAIAKRVDHCNDCGDFPCKTYREWKNIQVMLPHLKETDANLETIKRSGTGRWIGEQEKKWRCPDCGSEFAWYSEKCGKCGRALKRSTYRFSRLKGLVLKIGMSLGARKKNAPAG